jgi:hypothetical protein
VVECLPSNYRALSSSPSTTLKKSTVHEHRLVVGGIWIPILPNLLVWNLGSGPERSLFSFISPRAREGFQVL